MLNSFAFESVEAFSKGFFDLQKSSSKGQQEISPHEAIQFKTSKLMLIAANKVLSVIVIVPTLVADPAECHKELFGHFRQRGKFELFSLLKGLD